MKSLYTFDEEQKRNGKPCDHEWDQPIREHGTTVSIRVDGDCFIQTVNCKKCRVAVDFLFNNKHPDAYISGSF